MKIIRPITVTDGGSFTRSTVATYYDKTGTLQSAAINAPRFGYDPTTLIPLGLIEEVAATNLLLYSEQTDNAAWTKTNATITANATTAPDGNATADLITVSSAAGGISQSATVTTATSYMLSCFVKAGTSSAIRMLDTVSGVQADYNLTTKTATITSGVGTATITTIASAGWFKLTLKFTSTSATATPSIVNNNGSATGTFNAWGMQLESGTKATSYIVTTSATVARGADTNTAGMLSNVTEADYTAWSSTKVYNTLDYVMYVASGVHKIYQSLTGKSSTVTITIAAPGVVSWTAHGLTAGTPIQFSTTGALPTGITAGTTYYVASTGLATNAFSVTTASDGTGTITTTGTQSGTHTAVAGTNINKDPTVAGNSTAWLDSGATNRWKMFDTSVQSQTSNADAIFIAIKPGSRPDSVALLNFNASAIRILVNDATDGTVYDQTISGVDNSTISDWYPYFFEPIKQRTDSALTNLPPYGTATVNIILYNTGNTVACGGAVIGLSRTIGDTEFGAKVGTQDYSVKTQDSFGNYTIVQRAYNKKANFTVYIDSSTVDFLQTLLASYRATPIVYIGEDIYGSTILYGFYKNFEIDIGYIDGKSVATLEVEGLT